MKHFFISYNSADRTWAEWIAWQLEEAGYTTVLQAWDFRPGSNFVLEMQKAAKEAERTIAVLSPDYLGARFPQPEWAAAFVQDPTGVEGTLLPVRVRECKPKGLLSPIVYVDLVDLDEAAAKDALLAGVRQERVKPTVAPGFPGAISRSVPQRPRFPGALPPIWNLPLLRNPNFTGREDLLSALRSALTSGQPAALTQAIHGLGGVGKTQLAVEYAYRHAAEYDLVWWVRAEEPAALAADYAALAQPLDLPEKDDPDQRLVVQAVRRWLAQNTGWLLLFDNARRPEDLRPYLPPGGAGHVLVTSRYSAWRGVANPLTVQVWERPESVAFLLKRTGQTDEAAADILAEALGDLPLALAQAGAYVDATRTTLADYLDLFQSRRPEVWEDERPLPDYPHTVATTWSLAMDQIGQESPASADLLNLCAYLGPDDIPQTLLSQGQEHLPQPLSATVTDPLAMNQAIEALLQYSLIERAGDALSVHRMVQAVARDRLPQEARRTWAGAAVRLVNDAFPSLIADDPQTWPQCARLLRHVLAVAEHAEALQVAPEATGRLLNQAGVYLQDRAEFAEAKAALERALAIGQVVFGPYHPEVVIRASNLGMVLKDLGDLDGATAYLERALAIWERLLGPERPEVASAINNLGLVQYDLGDLDGARAAFERVLAIDEAVFGPHHLNVAKDVNNLGMVLHDLGDLAGARAAFERALAIWEQSLALEHPNFASGLNNLGMVLKDLGDLEEARTALERALAIGEAALGPNHPKVARAVNNLGLVLQDLGGLDGAQAAFEQALAINEAAFGPDHPNVARDVSNLGSVLQDLGDLEGARAHHERALTIWEKQLGSGHPQVATGVNNLGSVLQDLGDLEGARAAFERALAIGEAALGPNHLKVARTISNLGMVLHDLGDLAGARAHLERALAIDEAAFGPDHPNVARDVNNLGRVLQDLSDLDGARAAFERALAIGEAALGSDHPDVARVVNNLGMVLKDLGDLDEARAALERALAIWEKQLGPEHPQVATGVNNLGGVLKDLGDLAGARAHFERALAIDEAALGPHHPNVARDVSNVGRVLKDLGDLAGARAAFEQALAIYEAAFGSDHPNVAMCLWHLGTVLQKQGEIQRAREAYQRALATFERFLGPDHQHTRGVRQYLDSLPQG